MNYREMRKLFADLSGRFDLVKENYADDGVGIFMNEGRKFLDRLDETQKSWAVNIQTISIGDISVSFPYCRAIKEVWLASSTEGRWQLEKKDLQDLMEGYLSTLPAEMETGAPLYYSPCITRSVPKSITISSYQEYLGYISVANNDYNGILLNVPASTALSVQVNGLFYSNELSADSDTNYWSEEHPLLLYMSTMRQIEVVNRSTQGVNDWSSAIVGEMKQLGMDLVEEIIAEVSEMEG